jgi:hypothetical protein
MWKLPLRLEICGYTNEVHLHGLTFSLLQVGCVCVAAISNHPEFMQNWDAPSQSANPVT